MKADLEKVAQVVGSQPEVAQKLDELLKCPADRAYIVCSSDDCRHNVQGICSIFTVIDEPQRNADGICSRYTRSV